ncbi:nucleotidyltransferase family protein [Sulfuricurvum sp.]|uniref:nucleotidyltransferase domain-containing protein n=1 Tax=Sulfuricurvum sp. TaxID=2025608 RepID=UPI0026296DE6|nr:nucleotidyltransferase family protein [Sulfuricurvum sp.]MDD3597473.1 nucleotidyltransferase family protein [Sulfuricurvum sp.]
MNTLVEAKYDLLIECCRVNRNNGLIETLINQIEDWDSFITSAYMHGVFPLVYKTLKEFLTNHPELLFQCKRVNLDIAQLNLHMAAELIKVVNLLQQENIVILGIKGPVLSSLLYDDISQRQFSDIDVLLHQEDIYRAVIMLESLGYRSEFSSDFLKNEMLLKIDKDFAVSTPDGKVNIEFHWKLFSNKQMQKGNLICFSADNAVVNIHNTCIQTLAMDIQLLYLLVHGSKHYWERLEWICDIDRLVRLNPEMNWSILIERARAMDIEGMVYLGLMISHELLETPLDEKIVERIRKLPTLQGAKATIITDIRNDKITEGHNEHVDLENLRHLSLIYETKWKLLKEYFFMLFAIKKWDIYVANLPRGLYWFYYFIRYYRIIKENIFVTKHASK